MYFPVVLKEKIISENVRLTLKSEKFYDQLRDLNLFLHPQGIKTNVFFNTVYSSINKVFIFDIDHSIKEKDRRKFLFEFFCIFYSNSTFLIFFPFFKKTTLFRSRNFKKKFSSLDAYKVYLLYNKFRLKNFVSNSHLKSIFGSLQTLN